MTQDVLLVDSLCNSLGFEVVVISHHYKRLLDTTMKDTHGHCFDIMFLNIFLGVADVD